MKIQIAFKNLEHSPAVDEHIHQKSEKLNKYLDGNMNINWSCELKEGIHSCDIKVQGPTFDYHATSNHENFYKCIDLGLQKVERQIARRKDKWKNKINRKNKLKAQLKILEPEVAWVDYDEDHYDDVA